MTPDQIRDFQRVHLNHLARPLTVDGIAGPETEWALDFETLSGERQGVIVAAQERLGLTESPPASNNDREGYIKAWLARCNAAPGVPWCAAFVSYCLTSGDVDVRIAGAQALAKRFPATLHPVAGDLLWYPTKGWQGHIGIVTGVSTLTVMSIEGNCNNAVRCVLRPRAAVRFARVFDDADDGPGIVPSVAPAPGGTR